MEPINIQCQLCLNKTDKENGWCQVFFQEPVNTYNCVCNYFRINHEQVYNYEISSELAKVSPYL
jgi:hypothetical protein